MMLDDEFMPDGVPAFRSHRSGASVADQHRCQALVAALDELHEVEERVDRVMTDILETGGSWQVGGPGDVPPRAAVVELQVHGVTALGRDIGQAIANWVAVARSVGEGHGGDL